MKQIVINKENGDVYIRLIITSNIYNNKYNNILVKKDGVFRVYYTDNQKRYPILQRIYDA